MTEIVTDADGASPASRVRGDETLRIRGRRGVLLATGGFEYNQQMRQVPARGARRIRDGRPGEHQRRHPPGEQLDASLDLMDDAWWIRRPAPGGR